MSKKDFFKTIKEGQRAEVEVVFSKSAIEEYGIPWERETMTVKVDAGGGFDYGNGTWTRVIRTSGGNTRSSLYDTRYQKGSFEDLIENMVWTIFGENVESHKILKMWEEVDGKEVN